MHCLNVLPPPLFKCDKPKIYWPISSKPTLTIPNNFLLHRQQAKYTFFIFTVYLNQPLAKCSQTLIQHHPHLAPMEVCKQKFPIMWYFNVLPPSTYCHPWYTTTNWDEKVVALYCTILFIWWHKDELQFVVSRGSWTPLHSPLDHKQTFLHVCLFHLPILLGTQGFCNLSVFCVLSVRRWLKGMQ